MESYTPKHLSEGILSRTSAMEGERKQVTVLFADVANFTSMVEKLDPEDVHQIMDGCFRILMDEVHKFEGTINQFMGDGVMALFGVPIAHEDSAQRACYAALGMQSSLQRYAQNLKVKFGLDFKMRIGISSGTVVVGPIGDNLRMDYTAEGDTTNVAARMENMADPGCILVSQNTYRKVAPYFEFRPLGPLAVKGKDGPLEVYELRNRLFDTRRETSRRIYSDLVGRENELNRLELHVLKVINGEGSVVNVIGEAGIGKSRLIAELKKKESTKRVALVEGRALAIGKNLSFHPIIGILKNWAGIREQDSEERSIAKLERAIHQMCPEKGEDIFPFIAILMGLKIGGKAAERAEGIDGEALEKLILNSIRELLIKAASQNPCVYVMEDLQWSDQSTIEFLESLFWLAEDHPILFINVFRPHYRGTGDRLSNTLKTKHGAISLDINLDPLSQPQSQDLIRNLTKGLPDAMEKQIVRLAEGNPFFIEEVLRSFIDNGYVDLKTGTFLPLDRIEEVRVPETIQDVIMARIDKLDEKTRELLKVASVIGRSFFAKILAQVADHIERIDEKLQYLKDTQLIRERERMGEMEYLFKHCLTQEVAYESILLRKRKELHLKVAATIESTFSDRLHAFYGILAYHYSNGEDMDRAEENLFKSGEEALRSSASLEAINYYQEALGLYLKKRGGAANREKIAALKRNIALAFFNKGQHEKALIYFDSVLEMWGVRSPKNKVIVLFKFIYHMLSVVATLYLPSNKRGKPPTPRDNEIFEMSYKRAMALVHLDPKRCFLEMLSMLNRLRSFAIDKINNGVGIWMSASGLFSWSGVSFRLSNRILGYTQELLARKDLKQTLYYELFHLLYNSLSGHWSDIKDYDQILVDANLRTGDHWHVLNYLLFHGLVKIEQGDFRNTETIITKLSEIWRGYGNENAKATERFLKLRFLVVRRELNKAMAEAEGAIRDAEIGRPSILYYMGYKAIIQILLKDLDGARLSLRRCEELVGKKSHIPPVFSTPYFMGQFLWDLRFLEDTIQANEGYTTSRLRKEAAGSGKKALRNSRKYAFSRVVVHRLRGRYFWLIGKQQKAQNSWSRSIQEAKRLGARTELARTYLEIGKRLLEQASRSQTLDGIEAGEYSKMAKRLFAEIGLAPDFYEV
jgi:class 3 adenylate cyclase/tetratricopeptide (TPR) repeat protein